MENIKKEKGIYIHIPFCKQKCFYCDFVSYCNKDNLIEKYMECLKKELKYKLENSTKESQITTVYIGGGTPSYIDSKYIRDIISKITLEKGNTEITIEVNPGTVTQQKLKEYKEAGINRISIGLQSTNNKLLKQIGRIHTYEEFYETYKLVRKVGINNINVDLMLGLPNQTIEDLKESLNQIIELNPEHISVYSLILEERTKLYELINENKLHLPDEEIERQMYWYTKNILELNGYKHYEISNFSKKGYESKHNLNCWKQKEYIGIGINASSYENRVRYSNEGNIEQYIQNIEAGNLDKNKIIEEIQTQEDSQKEFMLLGLRTIEGISIQEFKNKFIENPLYLFKDELNKLVEEKFIIIDSDNIKLTLKGLDFANQVWMEFA